MCPLIIKKNLRLLILNCTSRFITESTAVIVPTYTIQRDPSNFSPYPDEFIPERWLHAGKRGHSTSENEGHDAKEKLVWSNSAAAFIPFSMGPANCAGKNIAVIELRVVVALLTQRFNIQFAPGYDPKEYKEKLLDIFVTQVGDLPVSLTPRA